jgi:hypothetical protein
MHLQRDVRSPRAARLKPLLNKERLAQEKQALGMVFIWISGCAEVFAVWR